VTLVQLFIVTAVLGAVVWSSLGYRVATHLRHKRNKIMRFTIEAACRAAKEQGHGEPQAGDLLNLMELIQMASDRKVLTASYAAIRFEWVPNDPTD
jgi:hypothetical protein